MSQKRHSGALGTGLRGAGDPRRWMSVPSACAKDLPMPLLGTRATWLGAAGFAVGGGLRSARVSDCLCGPGRSLGR